MIDSHTEISQMSSRYALAYRLRRVLAWLTQRTQTLQVATLLLPPGCIHSAKRRHTRVYDACFVRFLGRAKRKHCEICVRQNNQREGNGKRAGWQAQAKRVCLCEFCALCVRQKKSA